MARPVLLECRKGHGPKVLNRSGRMVCRECTRVVNARAIARRSGKEPPPLPVAPPPPVQEATVEARIVRYQRSGDIRLRDRIVADNDAIVGYFARRYMSKGEPLDDLMQVGRIALVQAVDRFDASRGLKFSTFACASVHGELRHYLRDKCWTIRLPRSVHDLSQTINIVREELKQSLQRTPSTRELAKRIGATENQVEFALSLETAQRPDSFDALRAGSEELSLGDSVGYADPGISALVEFSDLHDAFNCLETRDKSVLYWYHVDGYTFDEIGGKLDLCGSRVAQLVVAARRKLRGLLKGAY